MKKIYLILIILLPLTLSAQTLRKYALVEHFTNTNCPICSDRNPNVYMAMQDYPEDVHHISIHPSVPYSDCELYQFNTADNGARESFYGIGGTPQVYINGKFSSAGSVNGMEQDIEASIAEKAGLQIVVEENTGRERSINVTIASEIDFPDGDYRIFVALLERNLAYTGRNGEMEHFDVLRDYITKPDGDEIDLPAAGDQLNLLYNTTISEAVNLGEMYTLVYIQNLDTWEILNSGTAADETTISIKDYGTEAGLSTFPNPVDDHLNVTVDQGFDIQGYEIINALGQKLTEVKLSSVSSQLNIPTGKLPQGNYVLRVHLKEGSANRNFVKAR